MTIANAPPEGPADRKGEALTFGRSPTGPTQKAIGLHQKLTASEA